MPANEGILSAHLPRLQLFGRFRLTHSGKDVGLPGRKARAILAYLLLAPDRAATREQLSCLMWTDRGPEQARASLRQSLKELREHPATATAIVARRDGVELEDGALTTDLREIGDAAAAHDLSSLVPLLDELRGDLLEDFLDISPGFDEWLQAERPRQRDLVLRQALDAVEANGLADMTDTRSILRSLDRLDPVNEAVVRLGMRLDHACGDGASLHRRYRQLCDRLDREFEAIPSEETRALFHSLVGSGRGATPAETVPAGQPVPRAPASKGGDMVPLVLVAPLQTHDGNGSLTSLADFCADDTRTAISRLRGVQVLAVDRETIASVIADGNDALGLYLLSGSIHQVGTGYRVTLQLANAQNHVILWSESLRFDDAAEEMLDTIVAKSTGAIIPAIDRDLEAQLRQSSGELDSERAMYTRARLLIRTSGHLKAVREGIQLLEKLLESDSQHLGARLLLGRMYSNDFWQQVCGHDVGHFRELSDRHLQAAAAIEPGNCETRIRRAWNLLRKGEITAARKQFDAVLGNLPHDAEMFNMCAMGLCLLGDIDEAQKLMQQAFFLNPLPPSDYHADYAVMLALKGEHEAAEEHFAVSGEEGMQYVAVRIANATALKGGSDRISPTPTIFMTNFQRAWQQDRQPLVSDVLDWIGYSLPFHPRENLEWVQSGLRQTLEPMWPAAS